MTMESISLSDSMCLHYRLAMVLKLPVLMETIGLCVWVQGNGVVYFRENFVSSCWNWLKTVGLFHFFFVFYVFPCHSSSLHYHRPSLFPMILCNNASKCIYPWKFKKVPAFLLSSFYNLMQKNKRRSI